MDLHHFATLAVVATPILVLFLSGAWIAARSGVDQVRSGRDLWRIAGNFSGVLLRVAGYVAVLMVVQHFIGMRSTFGW